MSPVVCVCPDLGEAILQWTDGLTGRVSREADLLPLFKRPCGDPVEVSIANPTSKAGNRREEKFESSPDFHSDTFQIGFYALVSYNGSDKSASDDGLFLQQQTRRSEK